MWTIQEFYEDDYGCEELPEGAPVMVLIAAVDETGKARMVRMLDQLAARRGLKKGDAVCLLPDGTLAPLKT